MDYTWSASVLWGGGTSGHVDEESLWASGIWKPADNEHFMDHDDNAPIPHIAKYGNTSADLDQLLDRRQQGELEPDAIYTAAIFVPQAQLTGPQFIPNFVGQLEARLNTPRLYWVGLSELMDIWHNSHNSQPNRFFYPSR